MSDVRVEVLEAVGAREEGKHAWHEGPCDWAVIPVIGGDNDVLPVTLGEDHVTQETDLRGAKAGQKALQGDQTGKHECLAVDDGACLSVDSLARAEERNVPSGGYTLAGVVGATLEGVHLVEEDGSAAAQLLGVPGSDEKLSLWSGQGLLIDDVSNFAGQIPKRRQLLCLVSTRR